MCQKRAAWALCLVLLLAPSIASATLKIDGTVMDETPENYQSTIKYLTVPPENQSDPAFSGEDIDAIKALEDATRREIYDKMHASSDMFEFANTEKAQENWHMRIATIKTMFDINQGTIIMQYVQQKEGRLAFVESNKWKLFKDPNRPYLGPWLFQLKAGEESYAGLVDFLAKKSNADCQVAVVAAILNGAAQAIGEERFNNLHAPVSLHLKYDEVPFEKHVYSATDTATHIPGDKVAMKNKDDYRQKRQARNLFGHGYAFNLIYAGGSKYRGLGAKGKTEAEVRQILVEAYKQINYDVFEGDPATIIYFRADQHMRLRTEPEP